MDILDSFLGNLPIHIAIGLFVSWLIWSRYFNENKLSFDNDVKKVIQFLRVFSCITFILGGLLYLGILAILLFFLTDTAKAIELYKGYLNNLVILYAALLFIFVMFDIKKKEFKKLMTAPIYALIILSLGALISTQISAYGLLFYGAVVMLYGSITLLVAYYGLYRPFWEKKRIRLEPKTTIKKIIKIIFMVFIYAMIFALISPSTNTYSQEVRYVISNENLIYLQQQIDTTINRLGYDTPISTWLPIKYIDVEVVNIPHQLGEQTRLVLYYKDNRTSSGRLSDYFGKQFQNGLKFVGNDLVRHDLLFEVNRSEIKEVKTISVVGFKQIENIGVKRKFKEESIMYDLKNLENVSVTYKFMNNLSRVPVRFDSYSLPLSYIKREKNVTVCQLTGANISLDNTQLEPHDCREDQCFFNTPQVIQISKSTIDGSDFLRISSDGNVFSTLVLRANLKCR